MITNDKYPSHKELPICTTPLVNNNFMGMQYSVYQACDIDLTPALVNHYTNIVMGNDWRVSVSHIHDDKWLVKEKIMHIHHMNWHVEMFENRPEEIIEQIICFISNGYYLSGNFNAFYIKSKPAYLSYSTNTVYLIYGYDLEEDIFWAMGKTNNAHFEKYKITFDEYLNSVLKPPKTLFNWNFIKYNDKLNPKTHYKTIYNGIYDYLNSKHMNTGIFPKGQFAFYTYGLSCYKSFLRCLGAQHEYRQYIEPTSYTTFMEHHLLMQMRIDYLMEQNVLSNISISTEHKAICDLSYNVFDNCLKYNQTGNASYIKEIKTATEYIIDSEPHILENMLLGLKKRVALST